MQKHEGGRGLRAREIYGTDGRRSPKERDRERREIESEKRRERKGVREKRNGRRGVYSRTWNKIVRSLHKTLERASKARNEIPRFASATT